MHFKQQPQKSHEQDILPKNLQIDRSFFASNGTRAMNYFASLEIFISETQDAEVTKLLPVPKRGTNFKLKVY